MYTSRDCTDLACCWHEWTNEFNNKKAVLPQGNRAMPKLSFRQPNKLNRTKQIVLKQIWMWIYVTRHLSYPRFSRNFVTFPLE